MKTMIAAIFIIVASTATADWEDLFKNPDLSSNYEGYSTASTVSVDPVAETYPDNSDLFAGAEAGGVMRTESGPSSLDEIGRRNPDLDCGCI